MAQRLFNFLHFVKYRKRTENNALTIADHNGFIVHRNKFL